MNILTFDVEEWFHILDNASTETAVEWKRYERRLDQNMERILSILDDRQLKATFFCLGWVAREHPDIIRGLADAGHEIATHSDQHQLAYLQSRDEFRADLKTSIDSLEDVIGKKITAYRAPGFSVTRRNTWIFDVLIEEGIQIDCSIFPASRSHGGFPDFGAEVPTMIKSSSGTIKEFPINTSKVLGRSIIFSGGGYFRLLPYRLIKAYAKQSDYIMTYFHPRDFDAAQPVIEELSWSRRFRSYYGLGAAKQKLERFIDEFPFMTLQQADASVVWAQAPILHL